MKILIPLLLIPTLSIAQPYNRSDYHIWSDLDSDCQNTRTEILIQYATNYTLSTNSCSVTSGTWIDPYSEQIITNPKQIDIDHIVPINYAHTHGAANWSIKQKTQFANDPQNLTPTLYSLNRQKANKGPSLWLPPSPQAICKYTQTWSYIINKYKLTIDPLDQYTIETATLYCEQHNPIQP